MRRALVSATLVGVLFAEAALAQGWKLQPLDIQTRWATLVSPDNALPEYPRPQLVRSEWHNLNGLWHYAITPAAASKPTRYDGDILVPYPLESALSGVRRPLKPDELLWYQRTITGDFTRRGQRILLHFGAVDYRATVYVNDVEIGTHEGGYQSFTFDITDSLRRDENELIVKVFDPTDVGPNPHGKQSLHPKGNDYSASSGIWQTVWLETVPETYIDSVLTTPDAAKGEVSVRVRVSGKGNGYTLQAIVTKGARILTRQTMASQATLRLKHPHLWSPDDPFLYDLQVRMLRDGHVVDEVRSYFGLRTVEIKEDKSGKKRIFLNGRYTYTLGLLDQGFWPEGLYTAPTDAALKFDIQAAKAMGFNTIRKHLKIEPERWYYYCDKVGLLVWQDMVSPASTTDAAHAQFEREIRENLTQLHNHPSIIGWTLFNEGWGGYEQERLAGELKALDSSRLVNANSGANTQHVFEWERQLDPPLLSKVLRGDYAAFSEELRRGKFQDPVNWAGGEITDIHVYPDPEIPTLQTDRVQFIGEHGGIGLPIAGHTWRGLAGWTYEDVTVAQMSKKYSGMVKQLKLLETQGLSGSIYTQAYDIESEQNGLMTYDREIIKIPVNELATINRNLVSTAHNYAQSTKGFAIENADPIEDSQRYAEMRSEYVEGRRDASFLRRLCLLAIKQADQVQATQAENEFLERSSPPYSNDVWAFIQAGTRTSRDRGFEILRTHTAEADAALGADAAESVIRDVIGREEIEPQLSEKHGPPDWPVIENRVIGKYGKLGAQKVYGAAMLYYLAKEEWSEFGKYYMLYFATAAGHSEYSITDLSYELFKHVSDKKVLQAGLEVCGSVLNSRQLVGGNSPTDIDTFAGLLYKLGKEHEAIEWEQKAERLSEGQDREITDHLQKMRSGRPTWPAG